MKYIKIMLLVLPMLGLISCVKQKNCNCNKEGQFIYLKEKEGQVVAHFSDNNFVSIEKIGGKIPKKFKISDTIFVSICYEDPFKGKIHTADYIDSIKIIECIEEID